MRGLTRRCRMVATAAGVIAGLTLGVAGATPAGAATAPSWRVLFSTHQTLTEITATGARDAWAVGSSNTGLYAVHWNGSRWRQVAVPGGRGFQPFQVEATSSGNVWIIGAVLKTSQPEVLIDSSGRWHTMALPAGTLSYGVTMLSSTDAWGLDGASDCSGDPAVCYPTVWHWADGAFTSYPMTGGIAGIAGAGSRVFVLAHSGAIYYGNATGLHRMTSPPGPAGEFPELAASPRGQLWLAALHGAGVRKPDVLYYWNGRSWSRHVVPAKTMRLNYGSGDGFAWDGHRGVWLGAYVHWTGRRWIRTKPAGPTLAFELTDVAPVPGSASVWAVGANSVHPGRRGFRGLITLYGKRP
jgi:hypothetical protein